MAGQTAILYTESGHLKAGMRVSALPNEPLWEVEDIVMVDSDGNIEVRFSAPDGSRPVKRYKVSDKHERHLTLEEASAEYLELLTQQQEFYALSVTLGQRATEVAGVILRLVGRG